MQPIGLISIYKWLILATIFTDNECAAMQVTKYLERADWRTGNTKIYNSLNKLECELAKKYVTFWLIFCTYFFFL
jgi:hypothetical protein